MKNSAINDETMVRVVDRMDMWFHKHIIHYFVFLTLTGLPLMSDSFIYLAYVFGLPAVWFGAEMGSQEMLRSGISVAMGLHRIVGILLIITAIPYVIRKLSTIRHWAIWPDEKTPAQWLRNTWALLGVYLLRKPYPIGRFNNGQKLAAYVFILTTAALIVTGVMLMLRDLFPEELILWARMIHLWSFIIVSITLIIHIYIGTLDVNRPGAEAMFGSGHVSLGYLKHHHPLLYKQMKKDGKLPENA